MNREQLDHMEYEISRAQHSVDRYRKELPLRFAGVLDGHLNGLAKRVKRATEKYEARQKARAKTVHDLGLVALSTTLAVLIVWGLNLLGVYL